MLEIKAQKMSIYWRFMSKVDFIMGVSCQEFDLQRHLGEMYL